MVTIRSDQISRSVMSDSLRPHRQQPTRLPHPGDSPAKNTGVGCHFLLQCTKVESESEVAQSCPTLSNPMDCRPPGSSIHGIFQQEYWSGVPLPSPRDGLKHLNNILSVKSHSPVNSVLWSSPSLVGWENWGTDQLSNLPKVTQLVMAEPRPWLQLLVTASLGHLPAHKVNPLISSCDECCEGDTLGEWQKSQGDGAPARGSQPHGPGGASVQRLEAM